MRPVRKITEDEEGFHTMKLQESDPFVVIKRDSIQPEPIGTIVLLAFRITGYDPDCDGSLMARLERIDSQGEATGWTPNHISLFHDCTLVVTKDELQSLFPPPSDPPDGSLPGGVLEGRAYCPSCSWQWEPPEGTHSLELLIVARNQALRHRIETGHGAQIDISESLCPWNTEKSDE